MRVEPQTDIPGERFAPGAVLFVEGRDEPLTILDAARDGPGLRVRFAEVTDRTTAERLRGAYLEAPTDRAARLRRGEYYWHELVGLRVTDTSGSRMGTIEEVYRAGGAEVVVVRTDVGTFDVPLVRPIVRSLAPSRGRIVIDRDALGLADVPRRRRRKGADEA